LYLNKHSWLWKRQELWKI